MLNPFYNRRVIKKTSKYDHMYLLKLCENMFSTIENRVLSFSFIYEIEI